MELAGLLSRRFHGLLFFVSHFILELGEAAVHIFYMVLPLCEIKGGLGNGDGWMVGSGVVEGLLVATF